MPQRRGPQQSSDVDEILKGARSEPGFPFRKESIEILATLRQRSPDQWENVRKDLKKAGVRVAELDVRLKTIIQGRFKVVGGTAPPEQPRPEDMAEAAKQAERERLAGLAASVLESDDVLSLFAEDYAHFIAGEEKLGKMLFLAGTSRLFARPMHTAIKGVSSGGKSEVRDKVLKFFPEESVISFTALSERALLYEPRDFRHRILCLGEAAAIEEASMQDYLVREMLSSGRLSYSTPQKNGGGKIEGVTINKEGPVALMITTTRASLHPENETRMLSLEIDDSEEQIARVMDRVGIVEDDETEDENDTKKLLGRWHEFQRWLALGKCKVHVPWARLLTGMIPPRAIRLRRDCGQVLRAVKAHALINQEFREQSPKGNVVAEIETDYAVVYDLLAETVAVASETRVKETIIDTVCAVEALQPEGDSTKGVTAKQVGERLKIDKSAAWRRLKVAAHAGLLTNVETRRGQPGRYRTTDQEIQAADILPKPAALAAKFTKWET